MEYSIQSSEPWSLGNFTSVNVQAVDGESVWVVDEAYIDPDAVRSFALDTRFWSSGAGLHPGQFLYSPIPTALYISALSELIGVEVMPSRNYRFAPFAMIRSSDYVRSKMFVTPHSDTFCDFVAVIYLSTDVDIPSTCAGTSFWRHLPTGLSGPRRDWTITQMKEELNEAHETDWLQLLAVQFRYNRMIVFPANLFHRIELPDSTTVNWLRLTQNLYLNLTAEAQR